MSAGASAPAVLAPGASCQLSIYYIPTETNPPIGTLTLTDDTLNAAAPEYATQTILLELDHGSRLRQLPGPDYFAYGRGFGACVEVEDWGLNPVPNITVNFSAAPVVNLEQSSAVTDFRGNACVELNPTSIGQFKVTASVENVGPIPITVWDLPVSMYVALGVYPVDQFYGSVQLPAVSIYTQGIVPWDESGGINVSYSTNMTASSPVGIYSFEPVVTGPALGNYYVNATGATAEIFHARLTIIADGQAITYGQAPGPLSYKLYGFVNGENSSVVSGAPILSTTVTSTTPRGIYPIKVQVGSLTAQNYKFETAGPPGGEGAVRVYKAPLTVTANTVTMTEGGTVPPLTYTITGFVNGEDSSVVSGSALLNTTATSASNTGEYPITVNVSGLSAENYYFVPAVHGGVVTVVK